jgi:hypothetical protein
MRTLNDGAETYAGISYTQIYSVTDEVLIPSIGPAPSGALTTGDGAIRNVLLQDICPLHVVADHVLVGSVDPVAYALVMDALNRSGPADPNSLPRSVCSEIFMPGVSALPAVTGTANLVSAVALNLVGSTFLFGEPPIKPYAG